MALNRPSPSPSSSIEDVRYERKFIAVASSVREVELIVKHHPALFRAAYPPRDINNVYLDTPGMNSYHAHLNGAANRQKTRIRWYGAARGEIAKPVLEKKGKRGLVNYKRSTVLPAMSFDGGLSCDALVTACTRAGASRETTDHLACRRPAIFNRYRRQYFESADRRVRLTIDFSLEFADLGDRPHARRAAFTEDGFIVVELKYRRDDEPFGEFAATALPFRLDRMSKYVRGVQRLTGWAE